MFWTWANQVLLLFLNLATYRSHRLRLNKRGSNERLRSRTKLVWATIKSTRLQLGSQSHVLYSCSCQILTFVAAHKWQTSKRMRITLCSTLAWRLQTVTISWLNRTPSLLVFSSQRSWCSRAWWTCNRQAWWARRSHLGLAKSTQVATSAKRQQSLFLTKAFSCLSSSKSCTQQSSLGRSTGCWLARSS